MSSAGLARSPQVRQGISLVCWMALLPLAGLTISGGGVMAYGLLAIAGGSVLYSLFNERGLSTIIFWCAASAIAYPFIRYPTQHAIVTFDRVWILSMAFLLLGRPLSSVHPSKASKALLRSLALLTIAYGIRMFFTQNWYPNAFLAWLEGLVLPFTVFLVTHRLVESRQDCQRIAGAATVAGVTLAGLGIAERLFGLDLATRIGSTPFYDSAIRTIRLSGPYGDPTPYLVSLLICLGFTIYWVSRQQGHLHLLSIAAALIELVALGLTFFRVAWLGTLVVLVVAFGIRPKQALRAFNVVGLTGVVLFFAFAGVRSSDAVSTRLNNTKNLQGRIAIYKVGLALFERSPATGVGINRFVPAQVVLPGSLVRHAVIRFPHNSYLATLAEGGVLVFIPLVLVTFYVWRLVAQFRRRATMRDDELLAAVMAGCALSYLLVSLSLTILPYGPSNSLLALLLGTGAARLDQLTAEKTVLADVATA